ncbi:hypothetical protein H8D36_04390 [archaeon]|nr:hypothetical protein [archaeon]MBL7057500.1 hypothetical protein [Candidatus Woesearchaeota archaeon]
MAYSELVSYIREQLNQGRDPRVIRTYLLQRNMDPQAVDAAFDEIFRSQEPAKTSNAHSIILIGVIVLFMVIIGGGLSIYYNMAPDSPNLPEPQEPYTEDPIPIIDPDPEPDPEPIQEIPCDLNNPEEKYKCYIDLFEDDAIRCHEIKDLDEQEFCYITQDLYVLNY